MNIFATSPNPHECAIALDDVRLRKMIVESAQLLSTALHVWGRPEAADVYKPTHTNHPCALWVQSDMRNYGWLFDHYNYLCWQYRFMRVKYHKTHALSIPLIRPILKFKDRLGLPASFPNCTPYPDMDTHTAYRVLLRDKWAADAEKGRPPKWTNRGAPSWAPEWAGDPLST